MTRRLLASLFVLATAFGLVAGADRSPVKVPTKKTEKRINGTDPKATIEDAAVQQDRLKRQFDDVKQALLRLAQRLEASSKPEEQEKAKVLRKAIKQAGEMGVDAKFSTLVALLKDANTFKDVDQLSKVLDNNKDLRNEIRKLIELLLKDDRDAELKRQREETAALLERLKELIARQERLQAKTDIGRTANKDLKGSQDDLAKDTRKLYDPNANKKTYPKAEAKYGGKDGKDGRGEAKDDTKDPKAGNKGEDSKAGEGKDGKGKEGKDGKPGDGKDGKGKEGKDGKPGDGKGGKEGKPGEGKDGKGGEGKEGKPGQGKDGKGGEGKDSKAGQGKDGKGGEGKAGQGKDGKGGEGKPGSGKDGKEGKPGDGKGGNGKEGKPGDGKGGKPGEGKPGAGKPSGKPGETKAGSGKPSNGKPGEGKPGGGKPGASKPGESKRGSDVKAKGDGKGAAKGGKPGAGKPSAGKPGAGKSGGKPSAGKPGAGKPGGSQGGDSKSGDSQAGKPGDSSSKPPEVTDARKKIQDSNKYQNKASKDLDQDKKPKASEDMAEAIKRMKEAEKKLEELLRQLREEEIERLLAKLQARCATMLAMQIAVYDGTVALDKTIVGNPKKQPARADVQASNKLSDDEEAIVLEANTAIRLIEAEGSAVAFGEVFKQVRADMITIAANLRRTDTGAVTQTVEKDVIETLKEMVEALKEARKQNKKPSKPGKGGGGGKPQDQKLISIIAELKMIRARQLRINVRTTVYGKQYEGEQVPAPETAKTPKERENLEILQKQLKQLATQQEKMSKVTNDIAKGKNEAK